MQFLSSLDFSSVWEFRWQLLEGLGVSFFLMTSSSILGLLLGILLAIVARSKFKLFRWCVIVYVEFFRNTPLLVQLIWLHFVMPLITGINTSPLVSGLIALTLNVTAYFSEIARSGIGAIPAGQWEAASAIGLRRRHTWSLVILPQALRIMIPPLANMVINIFKATAILSFLAIDDLMRVTVRISNAIYKPVETMTAAAILYLILGSALAYGAAVIERKYGPQQGTR